VDQVANLGRCATARFGKKLAVAHAFFIDEGRAEIAMLVANDVRRVGVGRLLFDRLIAALQQRRCTSVIAFPLAQNGAVSNLARSVGMQPGSFDGAIVTWTLSPAAIPPAESGRELQADVETVRALLQQALQAAPSFVILLVFGLVLASSRWRLAPLGAFPHTLVRSWPHAEQQQLSSAMSRVISTLTPATQ
jgi:hypothetical protein